MVKQKAVKRDGNDGEVKKGKGKKGKKSDGEKKGKRVVMRGIAIHSAPLDVIVEKKLARILRSNGPEEAKAWAKKWGVVDHLRAIGRYGLRLIGDGGRDTKIARLARQAVS